MGRVNQKTYFQYCSPMMSHFILISLLALFACGFSTAARCKRFRLNIHKVTFDAQEHSYKVAIVKNDNGNGTFKLTITNTVTTNGTAVVSSNRATVEGIDGDVYTFQLNEKGLASLDKERFIPCKFTFVMVDIKFVQTAAPFPRVASMESGGFQCTAPNFRPPKTIACKKFENEAVCNSSFVTKRFLQLPVSPLFYQEITIGFASPVKDFKIMGRGVLGKTSDCGKVFAFKRGLRRVNRNSPLVRIRYKLTALSGESKPPITYISYGNSKCRTSCGVLPVCEVTTLPPVVTTEPATVAPVVTTEAVTEAPLVTTQPETAAPVVTTEPETAAPVVTTEAVTDVPEVTTQPETAAPVVTTEAVTNVPVVTDSGGGVGPLGPLPLGLLDEEEKSDAVTDVPIIDTENIGPLGVLPWGMTDEQENDDLSDPFADMDNDFL